MDYMDPNIRCPQKAAKLNHSLTHITMITMKHISITITLFSKSNVFIGKYNVGNMFYQGKYK